MTRQFFTLVLTAATLSPVFAQEKDIPLQRPEERLASAEQAQALFDAVRPVARDASASTVWVWGQNSRNHVAMGTVVGEGDKVLTKWSQIAFARPPVQVVGGDGKTATASVLGVYQDEDVALLQLEDASFPPVEWSDAPAPGVGRFLVAAGPDGNPLKIGVVAVAERPLIESEQAFIGVAMDPDYTGPGVRIAMVDERGGADEAGLREGDVIRSLEGIQIDAGFQVRNALLGYAPGDSIDLDIERAGEAKSIRLTLGHRPEEEFPGPPERRLRMMRQMGGPISLVGDGFPYAIQTDMQLRPNQAGGPVVNLDGEVVGMSISRTDRTRSFMLPAARIVEMLDRTPTAPGEAGRPGDDRQPAQARRAPPRAVPMDPGAARRMRGRLEEMAELLERLDGEMGELERE